MEKPLRLIVSLFGLIASLGIFFFIFLLIFNFFIGGILLQYTLNFWMPYVNHHPCDAPFIPCALVAIPLGEVIVPAAAVTWICSLVLDPPEISAPVSSPELP